MTPEKALTDPRIRAELDQFLLTAVHDLRAPLRRSLLHAQMLERSVIGTLSESDSMNLLSILEGSRLANALLGRLAEYCHAGHGAESSPPVSAELLLQNAVRAVAPGADVTMVVPEVGDFLLSSSVQKVFFELLDNAKKFRQGPVSIEVVSKREGADSVFEIRDTGIGFDQSFEASIWEPFQRLHGVGEYPGFGFGLAIGRRIIASLGGRTWANGVPGKGSVFGFSIPDVHAAGA